MIIDASDSIIGRLATYIAKQALLGNKIDVVNSEKAVITGTKKEVIAKYKRKRTMGETKTGPFFPKQPDRILKRIIRGMLPYKQEKGRKAFKNIKCFKGIPKAFEGKETIKYEPADISKSNAPDYIKIGELAKNI